MERNHSQQLPKVLNWILYTRLLHHFGKVEIVDQGVHQKVKKVRNPGTGKILNDIQQFGEQYRVNCRFCGDERRRMYVGHTYGTRQPSERYVNWSAWYCFNEDCHKKRENRDRLRYLLELDPQQSFFQLRKPTASDAAPDTAPDLWIPLPANFIPLHELHVSHPALEYLRGRGFCPEEIERIWEVGYLPVDGSKYERRLIIPVYRERSSSSGEKQFALAGWQARSLSDRPGQIAKYRNADGMPKASMLYGLPQALAATGPVLVCEGPTDVWRAGPGAVALLGKSLSLAQQHLLVRHFVGRPIVVLLDRVEVDAASKVASSLRIARSALQGDNRVVVGQVPAHRKDPGACTSSELAECVETALRPTS